jgi:hypothetical protein
MELLGSSAQHLTYSSTGPPFIMPPVASTMQGSGSLQIFSLMSWESTRLNMSERNGFCPIWNICVLSWEFRYSG